MEPKPWWQSKTIWVNALTLAVLIIGVLVTQDGVIPESWLKWLAAVSAVVNVVLRFITEQPITLTASK